MSIPSAILTRHGDLPPETKAFTPADVTDAYLVQKYSLMAKYRASWVEAAPPCRVIGYTNQENNKARRLGKDAHTTLEA